MKTIGTGRAARAVAALACALAIAVGADTAQGKKCTDLDGDTFAINGGNCGPVDCDDADPLVSPGAAENCLNGIDDDCDGTIDVGDLDCCVPTGPEYGSDLCSDGIDNDCNGIVDCDQLSCAGRVPECPCVDEDGDGWTVTPTPPCDNQGDCDDADPFVHPAAPEDCFNGIDDDCDGLVDAADPSAVNCPLVCTDLDGDGYAIEGGECGPVDCDDANPAVFPGQVEDCFNGIDDDCDRHVDDGDAECGGCERQRPDERAGIDCSDGIDNDCNGFTDCADPECNPDPLCGEALCADGIDNDGDGLTDCDDYYNCGRLHQDVCGEIFCDDGIDNDGDGLTDCFDSDCLGIGPCTEVCIDGDGDGWAAQPWSVGCGGQDCDDADPLVHPYASEICDNGIDDDCDGKIDGEDCGCGGCCRERPDELPGQTCSDGLDNDCDGFADCADFYDCDMYDPICGEIACTDGVDNDGNGATDCADEHCRRTRQGVCGEYLCTDLADNDSDGAVDCADPDCAADPMCGAEVCDDGFDNDADGLVDCDDLKDCRKACR